jgi:3-phenylpropionate/trans-cinnamate dioxygenase ferredoxin subunit
MFNYNQLDPNNCEFSAVASVAELPNGERLFFERKDEYIVLFNIGGGYFAIADVCTHDDGPLGDGDLENHAIVCPRHGARFDVRTGEALTLPAVVDIQSYPVRVRDGQIEVGFPEETPK